MFEPRRGAGDSEEGRRGGEAYAEWPFGKSPPQVRQLSRKARDIRFLGIEGNQLGERCSGGLGLLTAQGRAGRGDAVVDPPLFRPELRSVRTSPSTPRIWPESGAAAATRRARATSPAHVPVETGRQENWDRSRAPGRGAREPWRDRRRRMRRGRRPPAPAELSDVVVDPRAVGLQERFQRVEQPGGHLCAVELDHPRESRDRAGYRRSMN